MGQCCSGEVIPNEEVQLYKSKYSKLKSKRQASTNKRSTMIFSSPSINFDIEKNNLTFVINDLLVRYNNLDFEQSKIYSNQEKYIEKIRMDQLWNIFLSHKDDFTCSNYLIFDLRSNKQESFLNKFKRINYDLSDMIANSSNNDFIKRLIKYLEFKRIIIIIDIPEKILQIDDFILFLKDLRISCYIKILDTDLNKEASLITSTLVELLDKRTSISFPLILASLQYFTHLHSNKILFIENKFKFNLDNEDENNNLFQNYNDLEQLIDVFHLSHIFLITNKQFVKQRIALKQETALWHYLSSAMIIEDIKNLDDLNSKRKNLINAVNQMHTEIEEGSSIIILIDNDIEDIDVSSYAVYFFISHVLQLNSSQINCLTIDNPVFTKELIKLMEEKKGLLEEFTRMNKDFEKSNISSMINLQTNASMRKSSTPLQDISISESHSSGDINKFHFSLDNLSKHCSSKEFNLITSTIEKIFSNIGKNYNNPKYYRIRSESNTFKSYLSNKFTIKVLEDFGFFIDQQTGDVVLPKDTEEKVISRGLKNFQMALLKYARI